MFRTIALIVCLIVAAGHATKHQKPNLRASIVTVEDLDQYLKEHPKEKSLQELTKVVAKSVEPSSNSNVNSTYERGKRTAGDRSVGVVVQGIEWATPLDHLFKLRYPRTNDDTVITFIRIECQQTSDGTRSYITDGGIGKSHITVFVEAKSTRYFLCTGQIYVEEANEPDLATTTSSNEPAMNQ